MPEHEVDIGVRLHAGGCELALDELDRSERIAEPQVESVAFLARSERDRGPFEAAALSAMTRTSAKREHANRDREIAGGDRSRGRRGGGRRIRSAEICDRSRQLLRHRPRWRGRNERSASSDAPFRRDRVELAGFDRIADGPIDLRAAGHVERMHRPHRVRRPSRRPMQNRRSGLFWSASATRCSSCGEKRLIRRPRARASGSAAEAWSSISAAAFGRGERRLRR